MSTKIIVVNITKKEKKIREKSLILAKSIFTNFD